MKKTISITLGKQFFHIEESAYTKLDNYLNAVKNSLDNEGKEEIINDIENRIAELFFERYNENLHTITDEDIDYIISVMGQPEDYALGNGQFSANQKDALNDGEGTFERVKKKRLYRDSHSRVLGGVCAGFAHYFGIDPIWVRIATIILVFFLGVSFLIYPILWIIIPKAITPSQILEMKGVPVNLNNISEEVKNSMGKYIEIGKEKTNDFLNILKKIVGVFAILFSVFIMFFIVIGAFVFYLETLNDTFFGYMQNPFSFDVALVVFIITALVPFVWILILGLKLINENIKISGKWILGSFVLWIGMLVFSGYLIKEIAIANVNNLETTQKEITQYENKFTIDPNPEKLLTISLFDDEREGVDTLGDSENIIVNFHQTNDEPYIAINENRETIKNTILKKDFFLKKSTHITNQTALEYNYRFSDNKLELAKEILFPSDFFDKENYTGNVTIDVYLNEGQKVMLNPNDAKYFSANLFPNHTIYEMKNKILTKKNS